MLVILIIIFLTFGICIFSKKSFGLCLPLSLISIPILLYLSQFIFNTFHIGCILIILLSLIGLFLTIYKLFKKDKDFLKNIFSNGLFSFLIIFLLVYITDYGKQFSVWDELAHWGEMVKEMLRLDKFYTVNDSLLIWHKDYPPFISLFELFWCQILNYSEEIMNISLHTFMLGLVIPYLTEKLNKKINIVLLPLIFTLVILAIDPTQIFKTIQVDLLISIMTLYPIILILFEKNSIFKYISLSLSFVALLLTKQIGIVLALMVLVTYILYEIFINKQKINDIKFWLRIFLIILAPLALFVIWNIYVSKMQVGAQFYLGNINVKEYLNILFKNEGLPYKVQGFNLFKEYLFTKPIIVKPFNIGYVGCHLIFIISLVVLYLLNKKEFSIKQLWLYIFIFTCGAIGYAFTLSVLYMFCFSEGETVTLACFDRYMGTYILIEYLFLLVLGLFMIKDKKFYNYKVIGLFAVLLLCINVNLQYLRPGVYFPDNYVEFKEIANTINSNCEENTSIFIVMKDHSYSYLLQYFLDSRKIAKGYDNLYEEISNYDKNLVIDDIFNQDYVYINEYPEGFNETYQNIFDKEINNKTLYKVDKVAKKLYEVN